MALSPDYAAEAARLPCNGCSNKPSCIKSHSICIAYNRYLDGRKWLPSNRIPNENINLDLFDVDKITMCG